MAQKFRVFSRVHFICSIEPAQTFEVDISCSHYDTIHSGGNFCHVPVNVILYLYNFYYISQVVISKSLRTAPHFYVHIYTC